ncbi:acetolactate synthase large subunit [Candidatus Binatia bacterium]|jgi:acetolactate synthase-1/2/3 large subunit|nr:acetolactate synthase large subunit [Candidatus Binatia bacterium]
MNGALAVLRTLVASGVDTCFTNPGTSEIHLVAALDDVPGLRPLLVLFEGVATGAADGYARMAGRPAATLLHLGPGLGNGLANLHNARRARSPIVNLIGEHATHHQVFDAPLSSDIAGVARSVSRWVREAVSTTSVGAVTAEAIREARRGGVATLILPADVLWSDGAEPARMADDEPLRRPGRRYALALAAKALRSGQPSALLVGGAALRERGLCLAASIAETCGAKLFCETFPARLERGGGLPEVERLAYLPEACTWQLRDLQHVVLVDAKTPVSFFAYPNLPSRLLPDTCQSYDVVGPYDDVEQVLELLAHELGAPLRAPGPAEPRRPGRPTGPLTTQAIADAIGALLPEGAIVSDEGNTAGVLTFGATAGAPRHDWLTLTGGAIGQGMPVATGAAVACPDRKVVSLQADGSALYTLQALWTQAREGLDVVTVILDNRAYAILDLELSRVSPRADGIASSLFDLSPPPIDFVALARGMGVDGVRVETADALVAALEEAFSRRGPYLIDVILAA